MRVSIEVIDWQVGVGLPYYLLQRQPKRFRWKARADGDEDAVTYTEGIGIISRAWASSSVSPACFTPPTTPTTVNASASFPVAEPSHNRWPIALPFGQ